MNRTLCDALNSTLNLQFKWRGFPCCLMLPTFLQYCFLFTSIARRREREESRNGQTLSKWSPSGFYVDDAELAITPEKKIVLSPCRGFSPGRAVSAGCSPATNQPRIQ